MFFGTLAMMHFPRGQGHNVRARTLNAPLSFRSNLQSVSELVSLSRSPSPQSQLCQHIFAAIVEWPVCPELELGHQAPFRCMATIAPVRYQVLRRLQAQRGDGVRHPYVQMRLGGHRQRG